MSHVSYFGNGILRPEYGKGGSKNKRRISVIRTTCAINENGCCSDKQGSKSSFSRRLSGVQVSCCCFCTLQMPTVILPRGFLWNMISSKYSLATWTFYISSRKFLKTRRNHNEFLIHIPRSTFSYWLNRFHRFSFSRWVWFNSDLELDFVFLKDYSVRL